MAYWYPPSWDISGEVRGRPLRYLLVTYLDDAAKAGVGSLTIRDLVRCCEADGVTFFGRASKIISDALRWEVRSGRVTRLCRGVYGFAGAPASTMRWIRRRVRFTRQRQEWAANERFLWFTGQYEPISDWSQQALHPHYLKYMNTS